MFGQSEISAVDRYIYSGALGKGYEIKQLNHPIKIDIANKNNV